MMPELVHREGVELSGFPELLCTTLQALGYPRPPHYKGGEFTQHGVTRCHVLFEMFPHPIYAWPSISFQVCGSSTWEACEFAALRALAIFCEQHPEVLHRQPLGLFPARDPMNLAWRQRLTHATEVAELQPGETASFMVLAMKAYQRYSEYLGNEVHRMGDYIQMQNIQKSALFACIDVLRETMAERNQLLEQANEEVANMEGEIASLKEQVDAQVETIEDKNNTIEWKDRCVANVERKLKIQHSLVRTQDWLNRKKVKKMRKEMKELADKVKQRESYVMEMMDEADEHRDQVAELEATVKAQQLQLNEREYAYGQLEARAQQLEDDLIENIEMVGIQAEEKAELQARINQLQMSFSHHDASTAWSHYSEMSYDSVNKK